MLSLLRFDCKIIYPVSGCNYLYKLCVTARDVKLEYLDV